MPRVLFSTNLSLFGEARYLLLDVGGEEVAGVPVRSAAVRVDQELLKVPRDVRSVKENVVFN